MWLTVFCMGTAGILVALKLYLEHLEKEERSKGTAVDPDDYRIGAILKNLIKAPIQETSPAPKTGDESCVMVYALMLAIGTIAAVLLAKKKRG